MVDNLTKEQRSYNMSRIRSKWTKQERMVHNILKSRKIKHKMHPKINGSPDIILSDKKIAVFLHGCFWHKCPIHYIEPKTKREYWLPKIERNALRDKRNIKILRKKGYKVVRIWEHEIEKNFEKALKKIIDGYGNS
jgi:DNA mismatch endonuclease (patch repair protein)